MGFSPDFAASAASSTPMRAAARCPSAPAMLTSNCRVCSAKKSRWTFLPQRRALLAGESRDVRFRLQGPLKDFPFENDKTGLFEVKTRVTGVTLDYADGWPPLTNAVAAL